MFADEIIKRQWLLVSDYISAGRFMHYSFDFWNTIAFSNPTFKQERAEFIYKFFNGKYNKDIIKKAFTKVGIDNNLSVDNNGKLLTVDQLYLKVIECIGVNENFDLEVIKSSIFNLFLKYPPSVSENFINIIQSNEQNTISFSITSNTAFIPGFLIEEFLKQTGIHNAFSFCIFSDDVKVAKPNQKIFEIVLEKLSSRTISAIDVLHIGDNFKADYLGAQHSGLSAFHMDANSYLTNARHALHIITDIETVPFSSIEYSKFKFGDGYIAKKFGIELFEYFRSSLLQELIAKHNNFLIYSSPYSQIPTSSYYLTQSFYSAFSDYLIKNQIENINVRLCKVKRCQTYTEDYGALAAEARFDLIKNDTYEFVDIPTVDELCIFIDDISITGTHQRVLEKLMLDCLIETTSMFLYFAKLNNPDICPSFENELNYSFITDVTKLTQVVLSESFKITTRTTKYILSLQTNDLDYLVDNLIQCGKYLLLVELVELSYENQYNQIGRYEQNLRRLNQCILDFSTYSTDF